jgi:hypothetical protein
MKARGDLSAIGLQVAIIVRDHKTRPNAPAGGVSVFDSYHGGADCFRNGHYHP